MLSASTQAVNSNVEEQPKTFCNPLDIEYQYGEKTPAKRVYFKGENLLTRSSADPVMLNHQVDGKHEGYYLFSTISGGYWRSEDLVNWQRIRPKAQWPVSYSDRESAINEEVDGEMLHYNGMIAPAALSAKNAIYLMPSSQAHKTPIFISTNPKDGEFSIAEQSLGFPNTGDNNLWDPALYYEQDDDQWYIYWGSSNLHPLSGTKLVKNKTGELGLSKWVKNFLYLYPEQHGWERFGKDHRSKTTPYIEGAEMNKHNGKYYLQYAAPGTSENVYSNGVYVGDSPLGPFEYAKNNPVSYKPGGFVTGVGHGNTFQDKYGNYWNTGTNWIGVNWVFERRITMLPAGFDDEGLMYANSRFADFPHFSATKKWQNRNDLFTGWMLLSHNKPVTASSEKSEKLSAQNLTNENPRSYWVAKTNKAGESVTIDLQGLYTVKAIQLNYTDYLVRDTALYPQLPVKQAAITGAQENYGQRVYTQYKLQVSVDGKQWAEVANNSDKKENRANPYIELNQPIKARFVKFENIHVPTEHLALSDIRVFGNGDGELPQTPKQVNAVRDVHDQRNATISWQTVAGAVGYNVLWGIAPNKLYQTYQVWAERNVQQQAQEIRALTVKQGYYFAVESFDENGVSKLSAVSAID